MKRKTCLKLKNFLTTKTFKLHEKCTITVEKGDRQGIQSQRIPAIIHRVLANGYYELATCAGLLKDNYRVEELGNYSGIFQTHSNAIVSLREAAIYYNNGKKNSKITSNKKKKM